MKIELQHNFAVIIDKDTNAFPAIYLNIQATDKSKDDTYDSARVEMYAYDEKFNEFKELFDKSKMISVTDLKTNNSFIIDTHWHRAKSCLLKKKVYEHRETKYFRLPGHKLECHGKLTLKGKWGV